MVELSDLGKERETWKAVQSGTVGIVHAAGVLADALLLNQTQAGLQRVWAPKAHTALNLHQAAQDDPDRQLQMFAMFSSNAAIFGNAGQANYAAANTYMDSLAKLRGVNNLVATSIQWGAWAGSGMAVDAGVQEQMEKQGVRLITEESGVLALELAVSSCGCGTVVSLMPLQWTVLLGLMKGEVPLFLHKFKHLLPALDTKQHDTTASKGAALRRNSLVTSLMQLAPSARTAQLEALVMEHVMTVGGEMEVDLHAPLMEAGLDSLAAIALRDQLSQSLGDGVVLAATVLFDHPTVSQLAVHVASLLFHEEPEDNSQVSLAVRPSTALEQQPLMVASTDCMLPASNTSFKFWSMLCSAEDPICGPPNGRWDEAQYAETPEGGSNQCYVQCGGFVAGLEGFDNKYFWISASEVRQMDPQQRVVLEVGLQTLQVTGQTKSQLLGSVTGVWVGLNAGEFRALPNKSETGPYTATGGHAAIASNRVSYALGLEGPSVSVDTACSSSIVALDAACLSLHSGGCVQALVGTVCAMLSAHSFVGTCKAHMLSPKGRCHTFDKAADGYVRAEGCCAVLVQINSNMTAVQVASAAVNQDGRTANLTSPNGPAQQKVIARALMLAMVQGSQPSLVDCHGTGTALGDPIEVSAQRAVLGQGRKEAAPLMAGAVKSSVGHLEAGAGLVGLLKVVLALQNWQAAPNLHFKTLNPHIKIAGYSAVMPSDMLAKLSPRQNTVAGVSSFGFGGTNSHALLAMEHQLEAVTAQSVIQYQHTAFAWWESSAVSDTRA